MSATPFALSCRTCIYIGLFLKSKNILGSKMRLGTQNLSAIHTYGIARSAYHRFVIDFFQYKSSLVFPRVFPNPDLSLNHPGIHQI